MAERMYEPHVDEVSRLFLDHGLRCTRQRVALYQALSHSKAHPTADELYRCVSAKVDNLSLATVYNTLDAFCDAGLARRIAGATGAGGQTGPTRYDATVHPHLHVRCEKTGALHDVPDELGKKLLDSIPAATLQEIQSRLGFHISELQIELVGKYAE